MLAGVLLHVIESPQPVNLAVDRIAHLWCRSLDDMQHAVIFGIDTINYACFAERPGVIRLAATGGIKRGPIENDRDRTVIALAQIYDPSIELKQARIVVIESFSCAHPKSDVIKCERVTPSLAALSQGRIDTSDAIRDLVNSGTLINTSL